MTHLGLGDRTSSCSVLCDVVGAIALPDGASAVIKAQASRHVTLPVGASLVVVAVVPQSCHRLQQSCLSCVVCEAAPSEGHLRNICFSIFSILGVHTPKTVAVTM